MNILVHALPTTMGGAKRHLENMMNALVKIGGDHTFFLIINDRFDTSAFDRSIRLLSYPAAYNRGWRRIRFDNFEVNRIVERKNIDLLLSFSNIGPFKVRCKHLLFEMNALYFCDHIFPLYPLKTRLGFAVKRGFIKRCATFADCVVTPSESLKKQIVSALHLPQKKFVTLPHAMQKEFCRVQEKSTIFSAEKVSFLFPSHLARHKGVHILLEALKIIKERHPEVMKKFEIVCTFARTDEPSYYDELTAAIERENLDDTIRFIGHQPQEKINALYAEADYMIYTTLCESFGFSMLEAKVFKLPALCSDIPINKEIANRSAHYYHWNDPIDLAQKIVQFIEETPTDFYFDDHLLHWEWDDYGKRLLQIMGEVVHG